MPVAVLIGYKDDEGDYHGFLGTLKVKEYKLLRELAERSSSPSKLSVDELKTLSDAKDLLARAQIKLYEFEKELSETGKQKLEKVNKVLGKTLESFDVYHQDAPQLDFLLSFCLIDAQYSELEEKSSEYESKNFQYVEEGSNGSLLLEESIDEGIIKHIAIPEDLVSTISEWIDLDGRRLANEASMSEDDEGVRETEIEWWRDNMGFFEYETEDSDLTMMLFRALRNNVLKCERTGKPVLSSEDWPKRMELL